MDLACKIALDATSTVLIEDSGRKEIDIKRYAKVEKVCCFFLYSSS
jgi:T-complex protein 1 subunit gamma